MLRRVAWVVFGMFLLTAYTRCGLIEPPAQPQMVALDPAKTCQRSEWSPISRNRWVHDTNGDIISDRDYQRIPNAEVDLRPGQCFRIPDCSGADPLLPGYFRSTGFNFVDPRPVVFVATGESRSSIMGAGFDNLFYPYSPQQESITEFLENREPEDALFLCAKDAAVATADDAPWRGWVTIGQTDQDKAANGEGADQGYAVFRYVVGIEPSPSCGNGQLQLELNEQCDDGNASDGDGCSSVCTIETQCGNNVLEQGEACDLGPEPTQVCEYGQRSCQVCTAQCTSISGETNFCGDGFAEALFGEQCDDGNDVSGDGCSAQCEAEGPPAVCGNGIRESVEQCDDGNTVTEACDYGLRECRVCTATCGEAPGMTAYCGDGTLDASFDEQCDDGNVLDGDACDSSCRLPPDSTIVINTVILTPDLNLLGGVRPRITPAVDLTAIVRTNEPLGKVTAAVVNCDPARVSDCGPVSASPTVTASEWSVELPAFSGDQAGAAYEVEVAVHDANGVSAAETRRAAPFEVYPVDPGLELQCAKRYDATNGELVLDVTLVDTGALPVNPNTQLRYTLTELFDTRYYVYQRRDALGWRLDETDGVFSDFMLTNPTRSFRVADDGEYQVIFSGLLGFTEPIQASLRLDTVGGPRDICPLEE